MTVREARFEWVCDRCGTQIELGDRPAGWRRMDVYDSPPGGPFHFSRDYCADCWPAVVDLLALPVEVPA